MNHGVPLTTWKANIRVWHGPALGHLRQRNFSRKVKHQNHVGSFFSIPEGSSTKNLSQLGKWLMLTFIKIFWIISSKELIVFVLICACLEIDFFSMTMHRPTMRHRFASFWLKKSYSPSWPFPFAGFGSLRLFLNSEIKITIKKKAFGRYSNHPEKRGQHSEGYSENGL